MYSHAYTGDFLLVDRLSKFGPAPDELTSDKNERSINRYSINMKQGRMSLSEVPDRVRL